VAAVLLLFVGFGLWINLSFNQIYSKQEDLLREVASLSKEIDSTSQQVDDLDNQINSTRSNLPRVGEVSGIEERLTDIEEKLGITPPAASSGIKLRRIPQ
jgi:hypothetical protein